MFSFGLGELVAFSQPSQMSLPGTKIGTGDLALNWVATIPILKGLTLGGVGRQTKGDKGDSTGQGPRVWAEYSGGSITRHLTGDGLGALIDRVAWHSAPFPTLL